MTHMENPMSINVSSASLPIVGLVPLTTQEFPKRRACAIFLRDGSPRCGYCHNVRMTPHQRNKPYEWRDVCALLDRRHGLLDGVVIGGGEPTLHHELPTALHDIKSRDFDTGLHTTGLYPKRLSKALPWLDWVRLDIRGWSMKAGHTREKQGIWHRNMQSLALLLDSRIELECRTSLHWRTFSLRDLERLAMSLADCGVRHYVLQKCLNPNQARPPAGAPSDHALDLLVSRLASYFGSVAIERPPSPLLRTEN